MSHLGKLYVTKVKHPDWFNWELQFSPSAQLESPILIQLNKQITQTHQRRSFKQIEFVIKLGAHNNLNLFILGNVVRLTICFSHGKG